MNTIFRYLLFSLSIITLSCEVKNPVAPNWNINANLPLINENYTLISMLKSNQNIKVDSTNNDLVLFGEAFSANIIANSLKLRKGFTLNEIPLLFNFDTTANIKFDDSTFVSRAEFIDGELKLKFYNEGNNSPYTVSVTIQNLRNNNTNQPFNDTKIVSQNSTVEITAPLSDYYIDNGNKELNYISFQIHSSSQQSFGLAKFDYSISPLTLKFVKGKIRPLFLNRLTNVSNDPLGKDVPDGGLEISTIRNSRIVARNYSFYQVDLKNASITGENRNGTKKRLYYDYDNNGTLDSLYEVTIPAREQGQPYAEKSLPITITNSNVIEFVNNVPKKISFTKEQYVNLNYQTGSIRTNDSISTKFEVEIPLRIRASEYVSYKDTIDSGFSEEQITELEKAIFLNVTTKITNGIPLQAKIKATVIDSSRAVLLYLTNYITNNSSDTIVLINASAVGPDGAAIPGGESRRELNFQLNRDAIGKLEKLYKIIIDLSFITTPNAGIVRIRGNDAVSLNSYGSILYRVIP